MAVHRNYSKKSSENLGILAIAPFSLDNSARPIQLESYIGDSSSLIDLSRHVVEYSPITTTALDITGFIKVELEVTLVNIPGASLNLDTRFNTRWARGNKVVVSIQSENQTAFIKHRTLRILSTTYDDGHRPEDSVSPSLKLKLGCKIALLDTNFQSQAGYKIPVLSNTPYVLFRVLLAYWLNYFKFPALVVVADDYAGNPEVVFDLPYTPGSSAAEHIGRFVYAYTGAYWWIDSNENSRLHKPSLTPTSADFVYEGRECAINARSQNEREKPAGLVKVFGVSNFVSAYQDPLPVTTSVTTANLTETSTFSITTLPLTRTTVKEGTQTITGVSLTSGTGSGNTTSASLGNIGSFKETTLEEYTGGFPAQPNPIAGQPDIPGSPAWLNRVTVSLEEQRSTTTGSGSGATIGLGGRQKTKEIVTDYFYRTTSTAVDGVTVTGVEVRKIVTTTKILPEGTTLGGFNQNALVDEVKTEDWVYLAPGRYRYSVTIIRPNDTENRKDLNPSSSSQNSPPPATQFAPQLTNTQPVDIFGKAQFDYPPTAPDNNHPRELNFSFYLPSNTRAKEIAEYEGRLVIGRSETQDLAVKPTDAWLADPRPAPAVFIHQDDNTTTSDVYIGDSVSLLCGLRQQYVFMSGIWGGIRDRATGEITAPANIKVNVLATPSGQTILTPAGEAIQLP
ncbi:MAG: hypothetical protein ACRCZS_16930 [Chroococcidiopsis sp.]